MKNEYSNIRAAGKWIFIKVSEADARKSKGGLMIPDTVEMERKASGIVLSIGPEVKHTKIGDKVIFGAYAGEPFEGYEYKFINEEDIIGYDDNKNKA